MIATPAATGVAICAALLLAACGGSTATRTASDAAQSTTASASRVIAGSTLQASKTAASVGALAAEIANLYRAHPHLSSYVVQNTGYTAHSRQVVFSACTSGGAAEMNVNAQTSRLDACAPLIFYFYHYGTQGKVPAATKLANDLFSYASDDVHGSLDSEGTLASVLRSWGIQVGNATTPVSTSKAAVSAAALLNAVSGAVLSQGSVRATLVGRKNGQKAPAEQTVVDMDGKSSSERIHETHAHAAITVTSDGAYISGDRRGLTTLVGLSATEAKQAGARWVEISRGSKEYSDLAAENTISALPSSLVPGSSDDVTVGAKFENGRLVKTVTWRAHVENSSKDLIETLELTAGPHPLPLQETTTTSGYKQTVRFSRWGEPVTVTAPPTTNVISYGSLGGQ